MEQVNKTLYIPLYGKAYVSRRGIILRDSKAEEIWNQVQFPLKRKSRSKWLAFYMGMRAAVFDRWLEEKLKENPSTVVLHIGCGLDSRCRRVAAGARLWYDIDFPEVIEERKRWFRETEHYRMVGTDVTSDGWLEQLPAGEAVVIMEGISMYLRPEELKNLLDRAAAHFESTAVLMDCYTTFAAKASRYKNPINDMGVTEVYGIDDPKTLEGYVREHDMTPENLVEELEGSERKIFRALYAGAITRKLYRMYEYSR